MIQSNSAVEKGASVKTAALAIRKRDHEMIANVVQVGRHLIKAKEVLTHDQFNAWAEAECGLNFEQARALIFAAITVDRAIEMIAKARGGA